MQPEPDKELDRLIHRELRGLPEVAAPRQLSTAVMAKIAARESRVWWQQPWLNWPLPIRLVSMTISLAFLSLAGWGLVEAWSSATVAVETVSSSSVWLATLREWTGAVSDSGGKALAALPREYLFIGLGVLSGLYLACIGLGTIFFRILFQPREEVTA